jgi:hypothetical protein
VCVQRSTSTQDECHEHQIFSLYFSVVDGRPSRGRRVVHHPGDVRVRRLPLPRRARSSRRVFLVVGAVSRRLGFVPACFFRRRGIDARRRVTVSRRALKIIDSTVDKI